jgi:hypothetical protein
VVAGLAVVPVVWAAERSAEEFLWGDEVRAGVASGVCVVDDERPVSEEGGRSRD